MLDILDISATAHNGYIVTMKYLRCTQLWPWVTLSDGEMLMMRSITWSLWQLSLFSF